MGNSGVEDRFEELAASLGGFYRTWLVHLGLELGLFEAIRRAGPDGIPVADLAAATGTHPNVVEVWASAADAHDLVMLEGDWLAIDADLATVLLDEQRPEYLGGQVSHAVVASLDWDGLADFLRTGSPIGRRPDRYRRSIERLTIQDVAVFFQQALAAMPQLVADLAAGGRVVDIHCGGGRWLIAMARRFPRLELVGLEFEEDSVARARANVRDEGLDERIVIERTDMTSFGRIGEFDLAYLQYALHQLPDPVATLRAAWAALRPGGRLVVLDWLLPSSQQEFRTRHGELVAGAQLDEAFMGTGLATGEAHLEWFSAAGLPTPTLVDLPSGASVLAAHRPG